MVERSLCPVCEVCVFIAHCNSNVYVFFTVVRNFIYSSAMHSTVSVTKARDPLPEVTVDGPLEGKVSGKNSFYITAIAKVWASHIS